MTIKKRIAAIETCVAWLVFAALAAVAILILAGCEPAGPKLLYGTVIAKIHKPAWTEHYITTDADNNIHYRTRNHPEKFLLTINENDQDGAERLIDTDKATFERLELGHPWYNRDAVLER